MQVQVWQAALFGLLACLASMPGLGGTVFGNYTLGRPLVAGLIVGLIMGDVQTGIYLGAAIQVVYIALVTPGGTVSADVRAISYIGIPLSMVAVHSMGLNPASPEGQAMAVTLGSAVGTIGTVLFYGTATVNLVWQHMGWRALEKGDLRKLYVVDMGLPWISHILCSFIPTFIITKVGTSMVDLMKAYLPMDGVAMKTLFTVGSLAPGSRYRHPAQAGRDQAGRHSGIRIRLHAGRVYGPQPDRGIDRRRFLRGHQLPHQDPCFAEGRSRSCICCRGGI